VVSGDACCYKTLRYDGHDNGVICLDTGTLVLVTSLFREIATARHCASVLFLIGRKLTGVVMRSASRDRKRVQVEPSLVSRW
jgi:hypothetical protein